MACKCIQANPLVQFPVFGPQPIGPKEFWPEYFVPDLVEYKGYGHYYCPGCYDGLNDARVEAGMPKVNDTPPLSFLQKVFQAYSSFWEQCWPGSIRSQATADESR